MEKISTIKIDGKSFKLTESAYNLLKDYDHFIRKNISDPSKILDIEVQMAVILQTGENMESLIVELKNIEEAINLIEINENVGFKPSSKSKKSTKRRSKIRKPRPKKTEKYYRDRENSVLGGVCSGISAYLGIDAVIIRVIFIVAFAFFRPIIVLYILLWVFFPASPKNGGTIINKKGN